MKLGKVCHWLSNKIQNYNLFMAEENDYDDDDNEGANPAIILQQQKYTTRLYIFILICKFKKFSDP